jgi:hypothetical protein
MRHIELGVVRIFYLGPHNYCAQMAEKVLKHSLHILFKSHAALVNR